MSHAAAQTRFGIVAQALASDAREAIAKAQNIGFDGLLFDPRIGDLDLTSLALSGQREFKRLLHDRGRQIIGLRLDLGPRGLGKTADLDKVLDRLSKLMLAARALGAPLVCVEVSSLPEPQRSVVARPAIDLSLAGKILLPDPTVQITSARQSEAPDPTELAAVDTAAIEIGQLADRHGAVCAFASSLSTFAAVSRWIGAANCPWFGADFDPVDALAENQDLDATFTQVGGLIRHVRARDAIIGSDHRTKVTVLGRGSVDWPALMGLLRGSDYQGFITIDPLELTDRVGGASQGLSELRKHNS